MSPSPPAVIERVIRQAHAGDAEVLAQIETGQFRKGFFAQSEADFRLDRLAANILEPDPAHLSPRFSENYVYRLLPDTVLWKHPVQVVSIEARANSGQVLRRARYYLYQNTIVAIFMEQVHGSLFFSDHASYFLQVRPYGLHGWVPYHIHVTARLAFPLMRARTLERTTTLYSYREDGAP